MKKQIKIKNHVKLIGSVVTAAIVVALFVLIFGLPTAIPVSNADFDIDNRVLLKYSISREDFVQTFCKKVIIPEGITTIASNAFTNSNCISSITIPKSVTTIGDRAFIGCSRLEKINVDPDNKNFTSVDGVLYNKDKTELICFPVFSTIVNLNIPDTVKIVRRYAFNGSMNSLENVTIPKDLNKIEDNAFLGCSCYININVNTENKNFIVDGKNLFNKEKTKIICYMDKAVGETEDHYSILDGVTTICGGAFAHCSLANITIPDSMKEIGDNAFYGCTDLTSVNIPNSVETIGESAFSECSKLTEITIPDSVETIGKSAFSECSRINKISIPSSVKEIGDMPFANCLSLTKIDVDAKNNNFTSQNGILFNKDLTEIICYPMSRNDSEYVIPESINKIGGAAFNNCSELASVKIPDGVKYIGDSAFRNCGRLLKITIPDSVTYIGDNAFYGCTYLTGIALTNRISEIGEYTFGECSALTGIEIPKSIKRIGNSAFRGCSQIRKIVIPDGVTSIGNNAFANCSELEKVIFPKSLSTIGSNAFYMCKNLATVSISENASVIGNFAFFGCYRLTSLEIPEKVTSIGEGIVRRCDEFISFTVDPNNKNYTVKDGVLFNKDMTRLISYPQNKKDSDYGIPNSVTIIGVAAFDSCKNLKRIKVPDGLETIEEYAFMNCPSLEKFDIPGGVNVAKDAFLGSSMIY